MNTFPTTETAWLKPLVPCVELRPALSVAEVISKRP